MGRTNSDHTQKIYLNIVGGKFAERVTKDTQGAVKRFSEKKQADVWEILNEKTSGMITKMEIEKGDFGKQLVVTMKDMDETFLITIPVDSKYFDSFCAKIGNADLSKMIELAPYSFIPKNETRKKMGMNLYQEGNKLGYFFSKEDPKGKPFPGDSTLSEDDWKIYKLQERKFYCEFIEKIMGHAPQKASPEQQVDDLPF